MDANLAGGPRVMGTLNDLAERVDALQQGVVEYQAGVTRHLVEGTEAARRQFETLDARISAQVDALTQRLDVLTLALEATQRQTTEATHTANTALHTLKAWQSPIQWENLWKPFSFVPGTVRPRVLLTLWQVGLVMLASVGMWSAQWWWPGPVGAWVGAGAGVVAGFWVHELLFHLYVKWVVRIPMMDDGDVVGVARKADYSYERWIGPVV